MGVLQVKEYFKKNNLDYKIYEFEQSTATVQQAAAVHGVEPNQIAKTMAFKQKMRNILVLAAGGARIDNAKYKATYAEKAKMMKPEEVDEFVGHPIGGVCPFGTKTEMKVYIDKSLKNFNFVYPAAGAVNASIKISVDELVKITDSEWIDICKETI